MTETTPPPRPAQPYRLAFFITAAIALVLAGLIIGAVLGRGPGERGRGAGPTAPAPQSPRQMQAMIEAVSPEGGDALRRALRKAYIDSRGVGREQLAARAAVVRALQADPYDPVAATEALQRLRAADAAAATRVHQAMVEGFSELTPEERAAAVRAFARSRMIERGGRGREQGQRPAPPPEPEGPPPP